MKVHISNRLNSSYKNLRAAAIYIAAILNSTASFQWNVSRNGTISLDLPPQAKNEGTESGRASKAAPSVDDNGQRPRLPDGASSQRAGSSSQRAGPQTLPEIESANTTPLPVHNKRQIVPWQVPAPTVLRTPQPLKSTSSYHTYSPRPSRRRWISGVDDERRDACKEPEDGQARVISDRASALIPFHLPITNGASTVIRVATFHRSLTISPGKVVVRVCYVSPVG
ncbi:hypothetical protein OPT61_g9936 [Boeremia exigua]|uniref:Uncharacterized protein n=1 Tax=Boeremia exigua TaxID=749465 RepID=A0ACC2HRZ5_9PLEO|nr:hypothetical protein OPT61_g9936 [Boeremia exigua]